MRFLCNYRPNYIPGGISLAWIFREINFQHAKFSERLEKFRMLQFNCDCDVSQREKLNGNVFQHLNSPEAEFLLRHSKAELLSEQSWKQAPDSFNYYIS